MRLLLDTCTFLWVAAGTSDLSSRARELFVDPDNEVYLSAVSAWEISLNHAAGRLPLPEAPARFVPAQRRRHGIDPLELDEESTSLHRDPFDRMLVCQAIVHGLVVLGPDPLISQYPIRSAW